MHKPLALLFTAAAVLTACGGTAQSLEQSSRDALPSKSTVAVGTPASSAQALRGGSFTSDEQNSTVGDDSSYYATTVKLAASINGAVISVLGLVEVIVALPPSSCAVDTCTWGPGSGPLDSADWQLVVKHDPVHDTYSYALSGRAKAGGDGQFHDVLTGIATPSGIPHRGSGSFQVDFDEGRVLNPLSTDEGLLQVTYSNAVPGQGHIDATFTGVKDDDHPGERNNAAYSFDEETSGGGSLQIAIRNLTSQDTLAIHSRWKNTGAGRGDVAALFHSGANTFHATVSECWGVPPFKVVYFTSSDPTDLGPDSGNAADCAFTDASAATLTAP